MTKQAACDILNSMKKLFQTLSFILVAAMLTFGTGRMYPVLAETVSAEENDAASENATDTEEGGDADSEGAADTEEDSDSITEAGTDGSLVPETETDTEAQTSSGDGIWPTGPDITASSAILIDAATGFALYEKEADARHYPASTTKILTTLLALENSSLDETVVFSSTAVYENEGETSNIARDVGEEMTMEQTLYAIMLESANECAYAAAEHVCNGDYPAFVDMMNERAQELGCMNTHFANANGLHDDDHYTSCRDMALISQDAIKNEDFRRITGTRTYIIPPTNKHTEETTLNNHHRMLNAYHGGEYLYDYCIGGKTGYTEEANNTLVTYAEKDNLLLISVVMETDNPYDDTTALLNFGFDNYAAYNVAQNETRYGANAAGIGSPLFTWEEDFALPDAEAEIILPRTASFEDTEVTVSYEKASGDVLGTLLYSYGGKEVGSADIRATGAAGIGYEFGDMLGDEENHVITSTDSDRPLLLRVRDWPVALQWIVGILLILFGVGFFLYRFRREILRFRHLRQSANRYKTVPKSRRW